ncbi:glutamate--cysteine ligase [Nocardiopsis sp. HNM0947]|uniref:Putative glutamate--cysteine ligase 2 n=1 Tax=Nocardiopsis coralli TaxID=2772213 RepID=A0ABR9PD64_9ACTN|nr:glutamate--cysteine ligase [Nocardiopsis coralli]MBE3001774.1 glutamate--cysteine ligase [Nocardiopsis coralli]
MEHHSLAADDPRPATVPAAPPTFGVEEEFFLVDPRTRRITSRADEVLARTRDPQLCGEFTQVQLEANSPVCTTSTEAHEFLISARGALTDAAERSGLAVVASGTPVLGDPATVRLSEGERYTAIADHFGALRDAHVVCGCHVHVGIPDRACAVQVSDHLRRWLPFLTALSANSPFHDGRDTGHASWRTITWTRLPSAGPPPLLRTLGAHDRAVRALAESGAILDPHMVYWDVRLSDHLPTLEVRVGDVAATAEESLLVTLLTRGLATRALADVRLGRPAPAIPGRTLRAALWRSARDGLEGEVPDPLNGDVVQGHRAADRLLRAALPGLTPDDAEVAADLLERVHAAGSGAARQRRAYERRRSPADVVDMLAEQTREGLPA